MEPHGQNPLRLSHRQWRHQLKIELSIEFQSPFFPKLNPRRQENKGLRPIFVWTTLWSLILEPPIRRSLMQATTCCRSSWVSKQVDEHSSTTLIICFLQRGRLVFRSAFCPLRAHRNPISPSTIRTRVFRWPVRALGGKMACSNSTRRLRHYTWQYLQSLESQQCPLWLAKSCQNIRTWTSHPVAQLACVCVCIVGQSSSDAAVRTKYFCLGSQSASRACFPGFGDLCRRWSEMPWLPASWQAQRRGILKHNWVGFTKRNFPLSLTTAEHADAFCHFKDCYSATR